MTATPFDLQSNVLSDRQLARIACLRAAREVLVSKALLGSGAADPLDLVNLARYIESGDDPYDIPRELAAASNSGGLLKDD